MSASPVEALRRAATSRATLGAFALFLAAWAAFAAGVAPGELFFPLFPAFAAAFFLDTVAHNQFGLRASWLFYPLAFASLYAEAACVGWVVSRIRTRGEAAGDRPGDA
jgi:hypothetical protein